VGGGQAPQVVYAHFKAVDARVGGGSGDAVQLQMDSAQALGDDGGGGRLANTGRSAQEVDPSWHATTIPVTHLTVMEGLACHHGGCWRALKQITAQASMAKAYKCSEERS
jgi:hypothetical protein